MKAILKIQTFKEYTVLASRAINSKAVNPIFSYLKLVADSSSNKISLTGTDSVITITTSFEAEVIEPGTVLLNSNKLNSLLERLGIGELTLTRIEGEAEISIHAEEYGSFALPTVVEEFPEISSQISKEHFAVNSEQLYSALKKTFYAAAETRQIMAGVHFTLGNILELAATDGHKLAVSISQTRISESIREMTVPTDALKQLCWALDKLPAGEVFISVDGDSCITFVLGEFSLTGRLLAGDYPKYQQLFPEKFSRSLYIDRASFLSGLARVSLFHEQDRLVNIELVPESKQLVLSTSSSNSGRGTTTIAADIEGDAFSIYFNCKYLTDILRHMQASKILIQFNEADQPALLSDPMPPQTKCLLMPIKKQ
jgi:DNA polymerase-3 subunit beta